MNSSVYPVIRPYYRIAKFGERVEAYSSLKERELRAGMERVLLALSDETLSVIATEENHRPGSLRKALTYVYPLLPPIDPRDILPTSIRFSRIDGRAHAEFVIRRGHHILAELVRSMESETVLKGGKVQIDGESAGWFAPSCLPDYVIEDEEQERYVPSP